MSAGSRPSRGLHCGSRCRSSRAAARDHCSLRCWVGATTTTRRVGCSLRCCTAAVRANVVLPAPGVATARKSAPSWAWNRSRAAFCQGRRRTDRGITPGVCGGLGRSAGVGNPDTSPRARVHPADLHRCPRADRTAHSRRRSARRPRGSPRVHQLAAGPTDVLASVVAGGSIRRASTCNRRDPKRNGTHLPSAVELPTNPARSTGRSRPSIDALLEAPAPYPTGATLTVDRSFAFVDICGFTAYCERSGEQLALELLIDFRQIVRDVVARRGVRVSKWLGDGVMIVSLEPAPWPPRAPRSVCAARSRASTPTPASPPDRCCCSRATTTWAAR